MQSKATTVADYLASLPPDRRAAIEAVRAVILENLSENLEEGMQYGMIGYYVPHSVYPPGYHCDPKQPLPYAGLASQKNYMSLYIPIYGPPGAEQVEGGTDLERWFRDAVAKAGKKLDLGKVCLRFKKLDDLALDVIAELFRRVPASAFIATYEAFRADAGQKAKAKKSTKKAAEAGA